MELFATMTRPFPAREIRWRALRRSDDRARAEVAPYLAAWAVMGRLDETVGPAGWTVSYQPLGVSAGEAGRGGKADALGLVCTLTVELEGVTVARQGGAGCRPWHWPVPGGAIAGLGGGGQSGRFPTTAVIGLGAATVGARRGDGTGALRAAGGRPR